MGTGPQYPNQQLASVSLETFFPGELSALSAMGAIQRSVRDKFPNLFVPNVQPGEALALRPYQLRSADNQNSLAIAVNQVTYVSRSYPGFDTFKEEAVETVGNSLEQFGSPKLSRVVYRYENEIGIARRADGSLSIEALFPGVIPEVFKSGPNAGNSQALNAAFEHRWEQDGKSGIRGFNAKTEDNGPGGSTFRLSVVGSVEEVEASSLGEAAEKAHEVAIGLFEALISKSFREFISNGEE